MAAGFAVFDVDFRGSTGYGRAFRIANHDEWGHADVHDLIDAARWAAEQPWSDGRLAIYGGSYGGYMVLCALVEEPSMWRAGVDLYGDSEIAESYRHGDRLGRLDLHKMMGSPDDAARTDVYRRGSPVYRAERIEAPLLILHGRKDKRVVPLMTERMVEALEIEGKRHEVHWYDEEGHGWEKRENRRDAFERILGVPQDERPRRAGRLGDDHAERLPRLLCLLGGSVGHVAQLVGHDDPDRLVVARELDERVGPTLGRQPGARREARRLRFDDLARDGVATGCLEGLLVEAIRDRLDGALGGPDARQRVAEKAGRVPVVQDQTRRPRSRRAPSRPSGQRRIGRRPRSPR